MKKVFYRYDSVSDGTIYLTEFFVDRETLHGVWLDCFGKHRFVLKDSRKKFAAETKPAAFASFVARKSRQAAILRAQLAAIESVLDRCNGATHDTVDCYPSFVGFES